MRLTYPQRDVVEHLKTPGAFIHEPVMIGRYILHVPGRKHLTDTVLHPATVKMLETKGVIEMARRFFDGRIREVYALAGEF